jgi:hypothetical protein
MKNRKGRRQRTASLFRQAAGKNGMTMKDKGVYHIPGANCVPTNSYESVLQMAASLSRDEQLRLIRELPLAATGGVAAEEESSVLALCGLGQQIWQHIDAQEYVSRERSSWNG